MNHKVKITNLSIYSYNLILILTKNIQTNQIFLIKKFELKNILHIVRDHRHFGIA